MYEVFSLERRETKQLLALRYLKFNQEQIHKF